MLVTYSGNKSGKITSHIIRPGGSMSPRYVLQLIFIATNSATIAGRENKNADLESLEF